ncbi:PRC-barrel domain-containing protein [Azospirillum sp. sgz301742]
MRPLRLVLPAYALLAAGAAVAQQPQSQPLTMLPPDNRTAPGLPHVAPSAQRPLTAAEAQALIGKSVHTRDGQSAGEIRDFTLAGPDGRIDRIVLTQGGFLGIGARVYAVPASALRVGAAQTVPAPGQARPMEVSIDLTGRDLDEAPDFDYAPDTHTLVGRR